MNSLLRRLTGATMVAAALSMGAAQSLEEINDPAPGDWPQHGRDAAATRYSPLSEINTDNVSNLQLTWARDLGFQQAHQGTPTAYDGILYVSHQTGIAAYDGATGDELWSYSSEADPDWPVSNSAVRGGPIVYDGKVIFSVRWGDTVAVDRLTGEEVWSTLTTQPELNEGISTQPILADGKVIIGPAGADAGGAPGKIHALDAEDGELLWTFDIVPLSPDDPAYDTWTNPPSWEDGIGGASAWNAGAYDPVTRTVVYGTGQPTPWDRLDHRRSNEGEPTDDLYTASFVAMDVDTGALKWYHQVVPADEWDMDQHIIPIFADVEVDGEDRRVALLPTTSGWFLVMDAESGEMLRYHQMAADVTVHLGYDEDGRAIVSQEARDAMQAGEPYRMCPGLRWAHIAPGAFSPDTGLIYRPNQDGCVFFEGLSIPDDWEPGQRAWDAIISDRDDDHWYEDRLGALTAIDPDTGEVVWEFGHQYGHDTGPVVTGGNLVFTASADRRLRAFDATTGDELWSQVLTAGSRAGTITYTVDGKQYVATMVGMGNPGTGAIPDYNPNADITPPVPGNVALFVYSLP